MPTNSGQKANDLDIIYTIPNAIYASENFNFFRIGKPSANSSRTINREFKSPAKGRNVLGTPSSDCLKESRLYEVSIFRDRTLSGRTVMEELDLTIKYINSIPKIAQLDVYYQNIN